MYPNNSFSFKNLVSKIMNSQKYCMRQDKIECIQLVVQQNQFGNSTSNSIMWLVRVRRLSRRNSIKNILIIQSRFKLISSTTYPWDTYIYWGYFVGNVLSCFPFFFSLFLMSLIWLSFLCLVCLYSLSVRVFFLILLFFPFFHCLSVQIYFSLWVWIFCYFSNFLNNI